MPVNLPRTSYSALTNTQGTPAHYLPPHTYNEFFNRYGGYSSDGWGHGVRNVVFSSPDPKQGVETWIRLENGDTRARVTLDGTFGR